VSDRERAFAAILPQLPLDDLKELRNLILARRWGLRVWTFIEWVPLRLIGAG